LGISSISWLFFLNGEALHGISEFDSSSSSSDEKMFERPCTQNQIVFATSMVGANTWELFNVNELDLGAG
jgi:hypothetical protein